MTPPRLQIVSLYLSYAAAGVFWGAFAAATPALQARAGLDAAGFGLAAGAMALAALPVMQVFGRVMTRIRPYAIPLCMAAFAAGCLMLTGAGTVAGLVAAFVVLGGSSGALDIALNMRTARIEEETGARLFNRVHAVFPFAMLVAAAGTGWLRGEGVPVPAIFLCVALVFAATAIAEWRSGRHQERTAAAPVPGRMAFAGPTLILGAIAALGAFQEAAPQTWAAIFVERVRDAGPAIAGLAPAAFTLGLSLGRLAAHELEDRLTPMATVRLAALIGIPSFAAVALPADAAWLLLPYLVAGIGTGPVEPAVFRAVARRSTDDTRGRMLATVTSVAYLGYLLSPPVLGQIAGALGWTALWLSAALAAAVVAALTALVPRR